MIKHSPVCTNCSSTNCFINKFTTQVWKRKISSQKTHAVYKRGETIITQGAPVSGIYFIHTGKVKVFITGINGRNQIVRLAGNGNILGQRGFGTRKVYPVGSGALEESLICFIPANLFLDALGKNPKLTLNLLFLYSLELKRAEYSLLYSTQMSVRQKLAQTLLNIAEIYGTHKSSGVTWLHARISRKDLADIIGASVEEVIRTLSQLNKEKIIRISGKNTGLLRMQFLKDLVKDFPRI